MKITIDTDIEGLRQAVADAIYEGAREGFARVERDFGPVFAAMARGGFMPSGAAQVPASLAPKGPPEGSGPGGSSTPRRVPRPAAPEVQDLPLPPFDGGRLEARRNRRAVAELEALTERAYQELVAHPGLTSLELAPRLGVETKALINPLRRLQGKDNQGRVKPGLPVRITATGEKAQTRYTPVEAKPRAPAKGSARSAR